MIYQLCQAYQSLPESGGVLDQSVEMLRMHKILSLGGHFGDATEKAAAPDPFAGLPMDVL